MNRLVRLYWIAQAMGWENVPRRVWFLAQRKLGAERRALPPGEASAEKLRREFRADYQPSAAAEHWQKRAARFFIDPERASLIRAALPGITSDDLWSDCVSEQVRRLAQGELKYFGHCFHQVGWPVRFHYDPIHDVEWPSGKPASEINQLDPRRQDIKCVWESSRFSVAYALAREHVRHPAAPAAEMFWQLFDAWDAQNPYGLSVNWSCSQEASFRLMAWLFAACATLDSPAATAERLHRLTQLTWYIGRQVSFNIGYARSQKNNHALSEAAALWTIGHLFPELRAAPRWREQGRKIMIAETRRQIYDDGSYVQHSVNYHRVMLDDCLWAMRIGELNGEPLEQIAEPVSKATDWLLEMIEPTTGRTPNYGPNDGADVLPLSCCDYLDYRPVAQAAGYLLHRKRCFAPGPWDEKTLWLFGPDAVSVPIKPFARSKSFSAEIGGYYTLAGPRTWGMTRVLKYEDRPHQADMLHFDLWCGGENILRDDGSYFYNSAAPWKPYFGSTAAHNTVEIGDEDQMMRGPRFLWLRWVEGKLLARTQSADGKSSVIEAEHYGYRRLPNPVTHRRRIERDADRYRVFDQLLGSGRQTVALRWRLRPGEWRQSGNVFQQTIGERTVTVTLEELPAGFTVAMISGQIDPRPEGWESLYYADRQPAPTIVIRGEAPLPLKLTTTIEIR